MVKRYNVTTDGMVEVGHGSWVHASDYDALAAQYLDACERLAAAESREVCTVAHDNVETCGYCQRDALAAELASVKAHSKFQADCGRQTSLALIGAGVMSFGLRILHAEPEVPGPRELPSGLRAMIDLDGIKKRDAEELRAPMSEAELDRRALLAYVDALAAQLAAAERERDAAIATRVPNEWYERAMTRAQDAEREREEMRELLREAQSKLVCSPLLAELHTRIDAALERT